MITEQQIQELTEALREMRAKCRDCFDRAVASLDSSDARGEMALEMYWCDCNAENRARHGGAQLAYEIQREREARAKGGDS